MVWLHFKNVYLFGRPSYSMTEYLPKEYYKAEMLGMQNNCTKYERRCPTNVLDLFSLEINV